MLKLSINQQKLTSQFGGSIMINVTTNYDKFKPFFLNRSIQKRNLENLKQSLEKDNLLNLNPIIVTNDFEILDGQHRFHAAKDLNLPIHYIQMPKAELKDLVHILITFNYSLSKWGPYQFLELYCKLEYPEYLKFKQFQTEFGLDIHLALPLSRLRDKRRNINEVFRRGQFVFHDQEKITEILKNGQEFLNTAKELLLIRSKNTYLTTQYFDAYAKTMEMKEFSQTKMVHQLKKYGLQLIESTKMTNYYNQLSALLTKR